MMRIDWRLCVSTVAASLLLGAGGAFVHSQEPTPETPPAQDAAEEAPAEEPGFTEVQRLQVENLSLQQQVLEAQIGLAQCQAQQQATRLIEQKSQAEAAVKKLAPDATINWATGEITTKKQKDEQ